MLALGRSGRALAPAQARSLLNLAKPAGGWADWSPTTAAALGWSPPDPAEVAAAEEEAAQALAAAEAQRFYSKKKLIRGSWLKLNLVAQQVRGKTVPDAIKEMRFSSKRKSREVTELLRKATWQATNKQGLSAPELEVARCWVGKGPMRPQVWFRGRGKVDVRKRRWSHLFMEVRPIDDSAPLPAGRSAAVREQKQREERAQIRSAREEAVIAAALAAPSE